MEPLQVQGQPSRDGAGGAALRFNLGLLCVFLAFVPLVFALRMAFLVRNWGSLHAAGSGLVVRALLRGLRFDLAAVCLLLVPAAVLYFGTAVVRGKLIRRVVLTYIVAAASLIPVAGVADLQYFEESGKHLSYEAWAYLGPDVLPMIGGAFRLHPWLCALALLLTAAFAVASYGGLWRLLKLASPSGRRRPVHLLMLPLWLLVCFLLVRGHFLRQASAEIDSLSSTSPCVNALCFNPVYSVLRTAACSKEDYRYFDEPTSVGMVRGALGLGAAESERCPMLQTSPGIPEGNRMNVIIFVLESWSAREVGCLGGRPDVTPFFDGLARDGMLFTNFHAAGVRSSEALVSILCSYPARPGLPIMLAPAAARWRSLSQVLHDAGYRSILVYGRDLQFDQAEQFLRSKMEFDTLIDRTDFPPSFVPEEGSWPGYSDVDLVRRADDEFAAQGDRPFLGCVWTMNTHPPFEKPADYPDLVRPDSPPARYLNSLNYSDHALRCFFDLARTRPYFANTVFLFVADHTAMRGGLSYGGRHHVPFLIYAPGRIAPAVSNVLAGQADILPTVLGLLELKAGHASWGRDLLRVSPSEPGFVISLAGQDLHCRSGKYLLVDDLADEAPLLFDLAADPDCRTNAWRPDHPDGVAMQRSLHAALTLSQTLFREDRICPRPPQSAGAQLSPRALPGTPSPVEQPPDLQ